MKDTTLERHVVTDLLAVYRQVETAKKQLAAAKAMLASTWGSWQQSYAQSDLREVVIARAGAELFRIHFDIDEWTVPRITRQGSTDFVDLVSQKEV